MPRQVWTFLLFQKILKILRGKLKVLKKDNNKKQQMVQNLTTGQTDSKQFIRFRKQLVFAAENFAREENLSLLLIPTMFEDMDEQRKLSQKVVDVVNRANKKIFLKLLQYSVGKTEVSDAQVRLVGSK